MQTTYFKILCINIKLFVCDNRIVRTLKKVLILRGYMLKYLLGNVVISVAYF